MALVSVDELGTTKPSTADDVVRLPREVNIRAATEAGTEHVHGVPQSGHSMSELWEFQSGEELSESLNFEAGSRAC